MMTRRGGGLDELYVDHLLIDDVYVDNLDDLYVDDVDDLDGRSVDNLDDPSVD